MPYYIGDVIKESKKLIARTPAKFEESGIHVILNTSVEGIDAGRGNVILSSGEKIPYDKLVVATGSYAAKPQIPGIDRDGVFTLKNLRDGLDIKGYLEKKDCRRAIIVGAGFIAMELSEAMVARGLDTSIVYRGTLPVKKWDAEFSKTILEELVAKGVDFITEQTPAAVEQGSEHLLRLTTDKDSFEGDIIIFALGVKPNVTLAEETGIALGKTGAIRVDDHQRTSREGIFSVGDCCEVFNRMAGTWTYMPLGDIANKQGRIAGRNIAGHDLSFPGVVGAQSFKVFGLDVAKTGLDEKGAEASGYEPASKIVWGSPAARSLGGGRKIGLKIVADRKTGKLLGAQAVGNGGTAWRINTLAACLWAGMKLDEVSYMDLAYSPPFGGAWDIIHIGAQLLAKEL